MSLKTVTGLPAITAGNLDDTAVFWMDDKNALTRKATVAQVRTQIFTGSLPTATFGAAVTVSAGGFTVTAGGITVTAGGVTVTAGGVSLTAGNLTLSDGVVTITDTTAPQLTVRYDASNHMQVSVSSAGAVTFNATGASAGFTFSDAVTHSSTTAMNDQVTITVTSGPQLTVAYDGSNSLGITVSSGGNVTLLASGANLTLQSDTAAIVTGNLQVGSPGDTNMGATDIRCGGALWIGDSIGAPTATSGFAAIYVDMADGDLKVKFADGTTKVLAADT